MDISGTNLQDIALISPGVPDPTGPLQLRTGRVGTTNYVGWPAADSFIITTGNSIAVSINSITSGNVWANAVLGNSETYYGSAAYGNGTYVLLPSATQPSPDVAISTDGFNWQSSPAPGLGANRGGAITYGDKFVRTIGTFADPSNIAWYSTDGTNWTESNLGLVALWKDVAYGNGRYVALSDRTSSFDPQTQAVTSADGISWTTVSLPAAARWNSVTYANGRFVAIGNNSNRAAYSTDGGNTWSGATLPANTAWVDVAYGNGTFLAVAANGNTAWSRDDGQTWANGLPNGSISPWNGNAVFTNSLNGGSNVLVLLQSFQAPPSVFYSIDGGNTWANVYREILPF